MKTNAKLKTARRPRPTVELIRVEQLEESQRRIIREVTELDAVLEQRLGEIEDTLKELALRPSLKPTYTQGGRMAAIKDAIGNNAQAYKIANEVAEYTGKTYVALSTDQLRFLISRWEEDLEGVLTSALKHAAAIAELRQLVDNREGR